MGRKSKYHGYDLPSVMKTYLNANSGLSKTTLKGYKGNLRILSVHLDELERDIMQITEEDIIQMQGLMLEEGKKSDTIGVFLKNLQPFFKWLMLRRGVDKEEIARIIDYCNKAHKPAKGEQKTPALTLEQQRTLFASLQNPYLRIIVWAGMNYGFRAQELCGLTVDDVRINYRGIDDDGNPDWGHVLVRKSKGKKTRKVYILKEHLRTWKMLFALRKKDCIEFPQVFYWERRPIKKTNLASFFKSHIASQVQFPITSHCMRRTFATNLYRRGVDIVVIQNLLGHETIDVTRMYLNVLEDETRMRYLTTIGKGLTEVREEKKKVI